MKENGAKRREWVKTAAIIFLSVLLVLTFFSNTIMNYSLPEVAAQYIQSGSITAKIRGNGVVESGDPYEVVVQQSRKVTSVAVRVGDTVQKGDVILYLDETESGELSEAKKNLQMAKDAYDLALLSAEITNNIMQGANANLSVSQYRQQITDAQNAVESEQKKVDEWQAKAAQVNAALATLPTNKADVTQETKAYNEAKATLEGLQDRKAEIEARIQILDLKLENMIAVNGGVTGEGTENEPGAGETTGNGTENEPGAGETTENDAGIATVVATGNETDAEYQNLLAQKAEEEKNLNAVEIELVNANLVYERAKQALDNKTAQGDVSADAASLQRQLSIINVNLDAANKTLAEKQEALSTLTADINKILNLQNLYDAVVSAQQDVERVMKDTQATTVVAGISGTVTELNIIAGQTTVPGTAVAVLQPEGQGYTMSFSVTNEQAKRVAVGDRAELVNSWYYNDLEIILKSIKTDKTDPSKKKVLNFTVEGDVIAGQSLNVSVGQKSADYEMIVPNSAIREDNNGKFILIVETKSSPLGNRYVATRVDVQVVASDDTKSAITGALYGWEFVITTSTKPVEAGQLVRLADN